MTSISAKVITDSISPDDIRLTTLQLRYPRFIHSELMTHRVFSRNASSSRAIPVERLIEDIKRDTAMPIHWGKNQPGMQAREECNELILNEAAYVSSMPWTREETWLYARNKIIEVAKSFHKAGYHKQIINRLLEPFSHINVLVTSIYWQNFLHLRNHPDAQPEIQKLAFEIEAAILASTPELLQLGEWHLPYLSGYDWLAWQDDKLSLDDLKKLSVARCARVSYMTQDMKQPLHEDDLKLYDRLVGSEPLHASPAEHQATPDEYVTADEAIESYGGDGPTKLIGWQNIKQHGNFYGWRQYRKMLKGEFVNEYSTSI